MWRAGPMQRATDVTATRPSVRSHMAHAETTRRSIRVIQEVVPSCGRRVGNAAALSRVSSGLSGRGRVFGGRQIARVSVALLTAWTPSSAFGSPLLPTPSHHRAVLFDRLAQLPPALLIALGVQLADAGEPYQDGDAGLGRSLPRCQFGSASRRGMSYHVKFHCGGLVVDTHFATLRLHHGQYMLSSHDPDAQFWRAVGQ